MKALTIDEINNKKPKDSRLTVVSFARKTIDSGGASRRFVWVICICGKKKKKLVTSITTGDAKSCGCMQKENWIAFLTKYTHPTTGNTKGVYGSYHSMMRRCYNKEDVSYKGYGAKGVKVCKEWRNSYQAFLNWSLANGWKPGMHLDKDKIGNGKLYSPKNCCWLTFAENSIYKKRYGATVFLYKGKKLTLGEICKINGLKTQLIYTRITRGKKSLQEALFMGNKNWSGHKNINFKIKKQL